MKDQVQEPTISLVAEIPEKLHKSMRAYLDSIQGFGSDQDIVFTEALTLYLKIKGVEGLIPCPFRNDGDLFKREK